MNAQTDPSTAKPKAGTAPAGNPCNEGPCTEAQSHLWDYIDGELDDVDCTRIRTHLEECPPCGQMFKNERKVKDAVARACGSCEDVPQDLRSRVVAMVSQLRSEACGGKK